MYDAAVAGRAQGNILMCKVGIGSYLPTCFFSNKRRVLNEFMVKWSKDLDIWL